MVPQLQFARPRTDAGARGGAPAQGRRGARLFRAQEPARRQLLAATARRGNRCRDYSGSVGRRKGDRWQVDEYYEARDKRVPVVLVLLEGQAAGLPFLRTLHWIVTPHPASESCLARLMARWTTVGTSAPGLLSFTSTSIRGSSRGILDITVKS